MKRINVFLLFVVISGAGCSSEYLTVVTRLSYDSNKVNKGELIQELDARFDQFGFGDNKVSEGDAGEIIIESKIIKPRLDLYNSLLEPEPLNIWNTYRVSDKIIAEIPKSKLEVIDLKPYYEFGKGMYPREVIGACKKESELERILNEFGR